MSVLEAIHTLRIWFIKHQLKLPRVTLTFDEPKDFYGFQYAVRNEVQKEQYMYLSQFNPALDTTHGSVMGIDVEVKCPRARPGDVYHRGF